MQPSNSRAEAELEKYHLWPGWVPHYNGGRLPLGPDKFLEIPYEEEPDTEVVGFAYPLPPVEYALRNERKYPPPSEEDMFREMYKLVHKSLPGKLLKPSYIMCIIYNHINRNRRDSPGWQRGFIKAEGLEKIEPFATSSDPKERYWVMAILGRMMGTSAESRAHLLKVGAVPTILAGTKDEDEEVHECAVCALKGLIQYPEGRMVVTYDKLIECLSGGRARE